MQIPFLVFLYIVVYPTAHGLSVSRYKGFTTPDTTVLTMEDGESSAGTRPDDADKRQAVASDAKVAGDKSERSHSELGVAKMLRVAPMIFLLVFRRKIASMRMPLAAGLMTLHEKSMPRLRK